MSPDNFTITRNGIVDPKEIVTLQVESGSTSWGIGTANLWATCIEQSLSIATARDRKGILVGIGFLTGNFRHAQMADIAVHPQVQRKGIARCLVEELIAFARENEIRYVTCLRDPSRPWLQSFYKSVGFRDIDFAMSHENAISQGWG